MRYLLILLLLISPLSFGNWGDTYFCSMNTFMDVKPNNETQIYQSQTFKFRLDEKKNAVVFPKTAKKQYFQGIELPITKESFWNDRFVADGGDYGKIFYGDGLLLYFIPRVDEDDNLSIATVIADCEKFE